MKWFEILIGFVWLAGSFIAYIGLYVYEILGVLAFLTYYTIVVIIIALICDKACPDRLNRGCTKRP